MLIIHLIVSTVLFVSVRIMKIGTQCSNKINWDTINGVLSAFAVGSESVSLVVSRQLLTDLCNHILSLENSIAKDVSLYALVKLQPRAISFEEQVLISTSHTVLGLWIQQWGV